jgi:hypothetical protein
MPTAVKYFFNRRFLLRELAILIYGSKRCSNTSFSSSRLLASFNRSGAEYTATATDFAAWEK